ncbi:MAG: transcription termination/antitermination factor NusG [Rikenellaceae bacterium]|nr:transcription termination/antitermination factor NusG [Rikenellaceae bacterium]MBR2451806.1 transcription termination/antitermination factor NusG [Rikenellaceae bacterium]
MSEIKEVASLKQEGQKTEPAWYVVRAIGGKENKVKEYIESEIRHLHLEDRIFQVLIPTEKVFTIRNGKKVSKERVSYPGYVLVECIFAGDVPYILRNTPNVLGFLGDTKEDNRKMKATPLRPQEVSRILGRVDEINSGEEEMEELFIVGETVKVTDGPFASFTGTVESVDVDRKKITVSVKIFGRKTPMELSFTQVEKE